MANKPHILQTLNPQQLECVTNSDEKVLVVAGAGSGKTTVLVSRIFYYLTAKNIKPSEILALTFTNKAGAEIKERVEKTGEVSLERAWLTTFHSACARMLRFYGHLVGIPGDFMIIDTQHQRDLVKKIMDLNNLPMPPKLRKDVLAGIFMRLIDYIKEHQVRADGLAAFVENDGLVKNVLIRQGIEMSTLTSLYRIYESSLQRENIFDFTELILRTVESLEHNESFRTALQDRFKAILVDEFQDTNALQYKLLTLLCAQHTKLFIVGDDDQSIYGFRGADAYNMQKLVKTFPGIKLYKLDINYRSYQNILDVANTLINHNENRILEKHLNTNRGSGEKVTFIKCETDDTECSALVHMINTLVKGDGAKYGDIAILYRNNYLSAKIERSLNASGIDYEVIGSKKFYEREEIQNAISYLRLAANLNDDTSFAKIVNLPTRKIGPKALHDLNVYASKHSLSMSYAVLQLHERKNAGDKLGREEAALLAKFHPFVSMMQGFHQQIEKTPLYETANELLNDSGLMEYYELRDEKEGRVDYLSRVSNLQELVGLIRSYDEQYDKMNDEQKVNEGGKAYGFLSKVALTSSAEINEQGRDVPTDIYGRKKNNKVRLLTIHASKGLEFKYVMIADFNEGIIPSGKVEMIENEEKRSDSLQEERRLAYVAVTRAKEGLWIFYTIHRRNFRGLMDISMPSRFLYEVHASYEGSDERPYDSVEYVYD